MISSLIDNSNLMGVGQIESELNRDNGFIPFYSKSDLLRRAASQHSWTRATGISIGRAAIGGGFSFVRHPIFGLDISARRQREIDRIIKKVHKCFFGAPVDDNYIQSLVTLSSKMYYTANSFAVYGQSTWEKVRDAKTGEMIGFDALPGITMPNVDFQGKFMSPAFIFRAWNTEKLVEYNKKDVVYFASPGLDMSIFGSSDYDSLIDNTIPSDVYASKAYKYQFENINAPYNGIWVVDPSTEKEDYDDFMALLAARYTGIEAFGSNPLVIRGMAKFEEHRSRSNDDAPYLEGRRYNQEEISAVTGISSAKLGVTDNASKTNHRELRREFHENTLRPIFSFIEESIYNQVMISEFDIPEYKLQFNRPDLSTALEEATILGRYVQNGVISSNEARLALGKPTRVDEYGNKYFIPANGSWVDAKGVSTPLQELEANPDGTQTPEVKEQDPTPDINEPRPEDGSSKRQFDMKRDPAEDDTYTDTRKSDIFYHIDQWRELGKSYQYDGDNQQMKDIQTIVNYAQDEDCGIFINALYEELTEK